MECVQSINQITQKRGLSLADTVTARPLKRPKTDDSASALVQNIPILAFSPFAASAETDLTHKVTLRQEDSVPPSPSEHDVFDLGLELDSDYSLSEDNASSDEVFASLDASSMDWEVQSPRSMGLPSMDIDLADLLTQECPVVPRVVGVPKLPSNKMPKTMKKSTVQKLPAAAKPPQPRPITSKADCPACRGKHRAHTCLEHGHRARNNYGRVASGDRCGECTNCLRPHWKKRCLNLSPDKFCEHGYIRIGVGGLGAGCQQCHGTTTTLQDSRGRPIVKPVLCEPVLATPRLLVATAPQPPAAPSVLEAALEMVEVEMTSAAAVKPPVAAPVAAPVPTPVAPAAPVLEVKKVEEAKAETQDDDVISTGSTDTIEAPVEISDKKEAHRLEISFVGETETASSPLGRGKRGSTRRSYAFIEAC